MVIGELHDSEILASLVLKGFTTSTMEVRFFCKPADSSNYSNLSSEKAYQGKLRSPFKYFNTLTGHGRHQFCIFIRYYFLRKRLINHVGAGLREFPTRFHGALQNAAKGQKTERKELNGASDDTDKYGEIDGEREDQYLRQLRLNTEQEQEQPTRQEFDIPESPLDEQRIQSLLGAEATLYDIFSDEEMINNNQNSNTEDEIGPPAVPERQSTPSSTSSGDQSKKRKYKDDYMMQVDISLTKEINGLDDEIDALEFKLEGMRNRRQKLYEQRSQNGKRMSIRASKRVDSSFRSSRSTSLRSRK